jgi:hypothetical protein
MLKSAFILLVCQLLIFHPTEQENNPDMIEWTPEYQLRWEDFRGEPDSLRAPDEQSATKIQLKVTVKSTSKLVIFNVPCYFEKDKSWTVCDTSSHLLKHEQLHFDIGELYARNIRKRLKEMTITSDKETEKKVRAIYHDEIAACNEFQHLYDRETNHSKNRAMQRVWNEKIETMLINTVSYKPTVITIKKR